MLKSLGKCCPKTPESRDGTEKCSRLRPWLPSTSAYAPGDVGRLVDDLNQLMNSDEAHCAVAWRPIVTSRRGLPKTRTDPRRCRSIDKHCSVPGCETLAGDQKNHCEGRSNLLSSLAFVRRVRSAGTFASGGRRTTRNVRYNGPAHLPSKCPFPLGIYNLRLTHGSLGCPPLTASRSVQPFSHNSSVYTHKHTQTYRQTHRPRYVRHL